MTTSDTSTSTASATSQSSGTQTYHLTRSEETENSIDLTVDIREISTCERHVRVTIPRTEVDRFFDAEIGEFHDKAHIPGFRLGKAPKKLIEKRYRREVEAQVKQTLIMDSLQSVNTMKELTAIDEPDFDFNSVTLPETGDFVYEFRLEVRPNFVMPDWKGLTLTRPVHDFTEKDVDDTIRNALREEAALLPKDGPAVSGDYIHTKIVVKAGDKVLSASDNETLCLKPELSFHDGLIYGFDRVMEGVQAGESRYATVTLAPGSPAVETYGPTVTAIFDVDEVKSYFEPELTPEFVQEKMGFESVAALRDAALDQLKQNLIYTQQQSVREQITARLTFGANWSLPPKMLKRQTQRELQRTILELQRYGYPEQTILQHINSIRQDQQASIAKKLKEHFILEKIAEDEGLDATERDMEREIRQIAVQTKQTPRRVQAQIEKEGSVDILRNQIVEHKVLELIQQHATFQDVPYQAMVPQAEAVDRAVTEADNSGIAVATEEDAKAAARDAKDKNLTDPNAMRS